MNKFVFAKKHFQKEIQSFKSAIEERHEAVKAIRRLIKKYDVGIDELTGPISRKADKINIMKYVEIAEAEDFSGAKDQAVLYEPTEPQTVFLSAFWTKLLARGKCPPILSLQANNTNTLAIGAGKTGFQICIRLMENQVAFMYVMRKSDTQNWNLDALRNQFLQANIIQIDFENFTDKSWFCSVVSPKFNFKNEAGCAMAIEYIEKNFPKFVNKIRKFTATIKALPVKKNSFFVPAQNALEHSQKPGHSSPGDFGPGLEILRGGRPFEL